jgi:deoxycytidylate deaminase
MISNKCQNILQVAYDEAQKSPCLHKHGCVASINGKIISRGFNNYGTCNVDKFCSYHGSCHAEIHALRDIWLRYKHLNINKQHKIFKKITIYVVRITSNGVMNSAPCIDCMKKLKELKVKNIIYSNNYGGYTLCKTIHYHTNKSTNGRYLIKQGMVNNIN